MQLKRIKRQEEKSSKKEIGPKGPARTRLTRDPESNKPQVLA